MILTFSFQVSEVLTEGKCRLSVSGWFHGPSVARPPRYIESLLPQSPHLPYDVSKNHRSAHLCPASPMPVGYLYLEGTQLRQWTP